MSKVSTVKIVDPRIEPEPDPVYATTISATQNQFYKIPASGLSDSYVTFNNLTTLGTDRAYGNNGELEITAEITFNHAHQGESSTHPVDPSKWTFDSWPFNKCCEEIRVNVNGGAYFSNPLSYLRAKERYWDEEKLAEAYANVCPYHKPLIQSETGMNNPGPQISSSITGIGIENDLVSEDQAKAQAREQAELQGTGFEFQLQSDAALNDYKVRTRLGMAENYYARSADGAFTAPNNSIVPRIKRKQQTPGELLPCYYDADKTVYTVTWREPIFCSPFTSKLDKNYGKPLYNITSMDLAFNLQDLGNMIRCVDPEVTSYVIHLKTMQFCYQVFTVPVGIAPAVTVVPYRRFVPYITDYTQNPLNKKTGTQSDFTDVSNVTMTSGVYTLNEIPTAIWVFAGPSKAALQTNAPDGYTGCAYSWEYAETVGTDRSVWTATGTPDPTHGTVNNTWGFNKSFGYLKHISMSMANTTQILNTASQLDLYRIAKANGCQDSFEDWGMVQPHICKKDPLIGDVAAVSRSASMTQDAVHIPIAGGCGSVLRLIPGTDIVLPEQQLIPGANANNMVFQVEATFDFPSLPNNYRNVALWVIFEYVGVSTITTGQNQIAMNPLGSGAVMNTAPVISPSTVENPSTTEGSGFLDFLKDSKLLSTVAGLIPGIGTVAAPIVRSLGFGAKGVKRARPAVDDDLDGGATMGLGDFC